MTNDSLEQLKQNEARFFDQVADVRSDIEGVIASEADIRRATKYIPKRGEKRFLIDQKITDLLDGGARDYYIKMVSEKPGARVLDVGCGSGWLALELARNGCNVDAYDISPKAIALARKMLDENPFKEGFGSVNYYLQDVSEIDLGNEQYDAVSGWSAFHHMPDVPAFMDKVYHALKPGGIVATMDDMPRGRVEQGLEYFFEFLLPTYNLSYLEKVITVFDLLRGKKNYRVEIFSPMEEAKHTNVDEIADAFREKFDILFSIQQNAFVGTPVMRISGPDTFRYAAARFVIAVDRLLCKIRLVNGFERLMIARKRG